MHLMGKVQNYVWQRWSLVREYPLHFIGMPLGIAVGGLVVFIAGLDIVDNLLWQLILVCSAYVLWVVALANLVVNLLFMRPDRFQS